MFCIRPLPETSDSAFWVKTLNEVIGRLRAGRRIPLTKTRNVGERRRNERWRPEVERTDRLTFSWNVTISQSRVAEMLRQKSRRGKVWRIDSKGCHHSRDCGWARTPVTPCSRASRARVLPWRKSRWSCKNRHRIKSRSGSRCLEASGGFLADERAMRNVKARICR